MSSDTSRVNVPSKRIQFLVLPIILLLTLHLPGACSSETEKESDEQSTFAQSPTNHEKVLSKKKETISRSDDYWVGSNKLEFKPHPLLMPSTPIPSAQIPIPIIELGEPPTSEPTASAATNDDVSTTASEEQRPKGKRRRMRNRRKKSRNQRLLAHRTLWANMSANNGYLTRALHPQLIQQHYIQQQHQLQQLQEQQQQQQQQTPTIIGTPAASPEQVSSSPLYLSPQGLRSENSFHGTATTWNINHPNNNLGTYTGGHVSGQESPIVQHFPPSTFQQYRFPYPQQLLQTQQFLPQQLQYSPIQGRSPAQQTLPISPSAPDVLADNLLMHSHQIPQHHIPHAQHSYASGLGGSTTPMIVYVPSGGAPQSSGSGGSLPLKAYNPYGQNEIPLDYGHKFPYPITGPGPTASNNGGTKGGHTPHYLRNNFLRMFMDKLASVGKVLPIPFVSKLSSSQQNAQQGSLPYNSHGHFNRRM